MLDKESVVPLDFVIGEPLHGKGLQGNTIRGMIITGPNTGGKTVVLKTVALLSAMACSGLHIPCAEADIAMNSQILCDIGDGQDPVSYTHLDVYKRQDVDSKYAKQSGGRGQYGHCKVRFEPMDANAEETFKFESAVVGGAIPKEYIPAVGAGIEEASKSGILAGFPVLGVKATVYDGSYHEVDSNEMAFKIAGSMAFKDAMQKAGAVLLEPIMKVEVTMPEEYMGDVIRCV